MNQIVLDSLRTLVSRRLGLHIREIDLPEFHQKLQQRVTANDMHDFGDYYRLLDTPAGESEWDSLIPLLTTGETYFFRDKGQIQLLTDQILPDIIARRRREHQERGMGKPSLRIWSAGCSYGEEPYTLAMLLTQLIPDILQWDILVLGTDLNPESVQKAKRGIYGQWSFRQVEPAIVPKYFQESGNRWEVRPEIRRLVRLRTGNLLADDFSATHADTRDMDLIICRNVFIYFQADTIATIVNKFYDVLQTQGYFIAGHTELQGQDLSKFKTLSFNQSVAFQKGTVGSSHFASAAQTSNGFGGPSPTSPFNAFTPTQQHSGKVTPTKPLKFSPSQYNQTAAQQPSSPNISTSLNQAMNALISIGHGNGRVGQFGQASSVSKQPSAANEQTRTPFNQGKTFGHRQVNPSPVSRASSSQNGIAQAMGEYESKNYDRAIQIAKGIIQSKPKNFEALHLLAQAHSDRADFKLALQYGQQALDSNPTSVDTLYLMACIAETQGDLRKTKQLLKQVIYLDPSSISAYLILADIYQQEGDRQRAAKMRQSAMGLLERLSPDALVEHQGETAAAASLLSQIQAA